MAEENQFLPLAIKAGEGDELTLQGLDTLQNIVERKCDVLSTQALTVGNVLSYESLRTENNAYIKEVEGIVQSAREKYLQGFEEVAGKVADALKPLKDANQAFANQILDLKKRKHKEWAMGEYCAIATANADGEIEGFEEVYDPKWYGKPNDTVRDLMAAKIAKRRRSKERIIAIITVDTDKASLGDLEAQLIKMGIKYTIDKGE